MKQHNKNNQKLEVILEQYHPEFKPFFESRVMHKISQLKEQSYSETFNNVFSKIALSGVAAVALLVITILISDGSLNTDALVGTSHLDLESMSAMAISNF